ncbi:MAG: metallophosphoesterase [Bdellovibrionales bacterium]|nr:metallophosphoesterase [Bdellovibrionales bacterium]
MDSNVPQLTPLPSFAQAHFTAVVSDLHLCEEEPVNIRFPYWKKYKTKEFFFDDTFVLFLQHLRKKSGGKPIELIFNGDIFDFDSVTALPKSPPFRLSWLEKKRGLHPQRDKSTFKIRRILTHHQVWVEALREFITSGNRVIFVVGNHDLELHYPKVQSAIMESLNLPNHCQQQVRFNEWFYISNGDTLIEHGNQYDPYCMAQDPINPYVQRFNRIEIRVPFGNLATRYLINGMGFFNPHVDSNYLMSAIEYFKFFTRYMFKAQPLLMLDWLWGSVVALVQSFMDRLRPSLRDPLSLEDRVEWIAFKANATPRMVRELQELFVAPASSYPLIIMRELWLDRAFLVFGFLVLIVEIALFLSAVKGLSLVWFLSLLIPVLIFLPFFIFYSRSVASLVIESKEPKEEVMTMAGQITKTNRIVYGHTHIARHEVIGPIEHLNCGTWSPAFADVECQKPVGQKTYVWIEPSHTGIRQARLLAFKEGKDLKVS